MRRSRLPRIVCGTLLALLLAAPAASAAPPAREDAPPLNQLLVGVCPFPVEVVTYANKEQVLTFFDRSGNVTRQLVTGTFKVRLTNTANGNTLAENVSGPVSIAPGADGTATVTLGGRSLLYLRQGIDLPSAGLILNSGQLVVAISAEGAVTAIVSRTGSARDLCAELAR